MRVDDKNRTGAGTNMDWIGDDSAVRRVAESKRDVGSVVVSQVGKCNEAVGGSHRERALQADCAGRDRSGYRAAIVLGDAIAERVRDSDNGLVSEAFTGHSIG